MTRDEPDLTRLERTALVTWARLAGDYAGTADEMHLGRPELERQLYGARIKLHAQSTHQAVYRLLAGEEGTWDAHHDLTLSGQHECGPDCARR